MILIFIGWVISLWIERFTSYVPIFFILDKIEIFFLFISNPCLFNKSEIWAVVIVPNILFSDPTLTGISIINSPIFFDNSLDLFRISSCLFFVCFNISFRIFEFDEFASIA